MNLTDVLDDLSKILSKNDIATQTLAECFHRLDNISGDEITFDEKVLCKNVVSNIELATKWLEEGQSMLAELKKTLCKDKTIFREF